MENILDNIAEKVSAQDIIRANQQAEAAEAERTRQEAEQYRAQLEELKENARENRQAIDETRKTLAELSERMDSNDTRIHDVGVQVYRNVQAVVEKGQAQGLEEIKNLEEKVSAGFEELSQKSADQISELGDTNEKAIRDIKDKNAEAFKDINKNFEQVLVGIESKNSAVQPLLIVTLLISAADLVINILRILGVL